MLEEKTQKPGRRRQNALLRAAFALAAAGVLLGAVGTTLLSVLRGPKSVESPADLSVGDYVALEVTALYDIYAEDYRSSGDRVTGWYVVTALDGRLVTLLLPERYFDSAAAILEDTYDRLNGQPDAKSRYFLVNGTVAALPAGAETRFYDWFSETHVWMEAVGLVPAAGDFSAVLSPCVIRVDDVGPYPAAVTYALAGAGLLLLLYAVIAAIRLALGGYGDRTPGGEEDLRCLHDAPAEEPWLREDAGERFLKAPEEDRHES